jgi:hypothetical protein
MCQNKSEGGVRCASHTRTAYKEVIGDGLGSPGVNEAPAEHERAVSHRVTHGMEAIIDYAATPSGRTDVEEDFARAQEYCDANLSGSFVQESRRQEMLSTFRVALRQAEIRNEARAEVKSLTKAKEAHEAKYRALFTERNELTNLIYEKSLLVEDSADAYEVSELQTQLHDVERQMESMETWRRRPGQNGERHPRHSQTVAEAVTDHDEATAASFMAWAESQMPSDPDAFRPEPLTNAAGEVLGECTECGLEGPVGQSCCVGSFATAKFE